MAARLASSPKIRSVAIRRLADRRRRGDSAVGLACLVELLARLERLDRPDVAAVVAVPLRGAAGAGIGGGPWRGTGVEVSGVFVGPAGAGPAGAGVTAPALDESGMAAPGGMGVPAGKSLADRKSLVA